MGGEKKEINPANQHKANESPTIRERARKDITGYWWV